MSEAGNRSSGFTLLETLVVIAIMALIAALVAPDMERTLEGLSLQQSVRLLQADLRVARGTALRTGQKVDLEATNGGREYDWIGGTRYMPAGVTLQMSNPIVVYPDGSVVSANIVMAARGRRYAIAVDPVTGGVTVSAP
ncbi:MAG TPA: prepilin-type N-terminal cleavage/methylation domain-containing protein [Rhizomicrobium sp.]|nr:prepilin-type N-terminal cleavage/methylation domain-containing protein [Rhizomicrobium sp.]